MEDTKYMEMAIELAKKGEGAVNPNPLVGAIVVKDGEIIGKGYHKKYGEAHAEVYALEEAGEAAKGATLYVSLEPCSHTGKTPPCSQRVIQSGISRCVIAMEDPNPLVGGRGIQQLREAGIEVELGILEKEAKALNRVFLKYIQEKVPFLFLKCGITLDGKLATRAFQSKWITNEVSREKVQYLRHKYMGIMLGIHSVMEDNPSLDARIEGGRNPYRIIVDPNFEISETAKLLGHEDGKNILIISQDHGKAEKKKRLEERGVSFILLEGKKFSFSEMLKNIGQFGIDSVLLEGGGQLISSAFAEDAIDGGEIFIAPKILGDEKAVSFVSGFSPVAMNEAFQLENVSIHSYGNNCSMEFYREEKRCLQD